MFRRIALPSTKRALNTVSQQTRPFFYEGAGEVGIMGNTCRFICKATMALCVFSSYMIYKIVIVRFGVDKQLVADSTDLWYDDGTVMEGEEATANLQIAVDRVMPFMDEYKDKIAAAASA